MAGDALLLADGHVHIYDCFDRTRFFEAAYANFRRQAEQLGRPRFDGLLLLSEAEGCDWFQRLATSAGQGSSQAPVRGWTFAHTREAGSLLATSSDGRQLMLIAGHQVVTAERLEVLALCCEERPTGGRRLTETVERIGELGGVPVVAWGAGKWVGSRGAALRRLLGAGTRGFFLGDNGGRLGLWPRPRPFRLAEARGIRVLPGSDPLPFPSHASRAGSFGFWSAERIPEGEPGRRLKQLLFDQGFVPQPYGTLARPLDFLRDQAAMQLRSRAGPS